MAISMRIRCIYRYLIFRPTPFSFDKVLSFDFQKIFTKISNDFSGTTRFNLDGVWYEKKTPTCMFIDCQLQMLLTVTLFCKIEKKLPCVVIIADFFGWDFGVTLPMRGVLCYRILMLF